MPKGNFSVPFSSIRAMRPLTNGIVPFYGRTGRIEEAIAEAKRALQLDPVSVIVNWNLGKSFYYARRYDETIEQFRKTLDLDPNSILALLGLGADSGGW